MLRFIGLFIIMQGVLGFLPFLSEVKDRTRWCLSEGSHCPLKLPFEISSCCKPYLCTAISNNDTTNWLVKLTHYKEHRCLLPASHTQSNHESLYNFENSTGLHSEDEITKEAVEAVYENIAKKSTISNISQTNLEEYEDSSSSSSCDIDSNEASSDTKKTVLKREAISESSNSSSFLTDANIFSKISVNSSESESSSLETSESNSTSIEHSQESKCSSSVENITDSINKENKISINFMHNSSVTNSSAEIDDDWSSSQMTFDTRPVLHKIVTIQPYHIFDSVEVIKLNESAERSY